MTKSFIARVMRLGVVDTRKYRYRPVYIGDTVEIRRLPLALLDTTAALATWELVRVIH